MSSLDGFRKEVRSWLDDNCPESLRRGSGSPWAGFGERGNEDIRVWRGRLADRGWTCPTWPKAYGGGGLSGEESKLLGEEMARIGVFNPVGGFGTAMLGPVLLEFANEEQKKEHLSNIAHGRVNWCQGYSEPGAGSDLAGLQTRAVRDGDHFVINGQKTWTSGAQQADWIFCLVRTDPKAPKHDGISFILFDLKSPGVTISPIKLISGTSSFCEIFFEDVRAEARNLIGKENGGWTIAKRLLQHERSMLSGMGGGGLGRRGRRQRTRGSALAETARKYIGEENGRLADPTLRDRIAQLELDTLCFGLTTRRSAETAKSGQGPGPATSMFKLYASEMNKRRSELNVSLMGARALGWEGDGFTPEELMATRGWLRSKGNTIEGGTSEIQLNVIAKRVLGLPD